MTIEQKAREIAATVNKRYSLYYAEQEAARLGIIEGLEMAAARVEAMAAARQAEYNALENKRSEMAREIIARVVVLELAATANRALIGETK